LTSDVASDIETWYDALTGGKSLGGGKAFYKSPYNILIAVIYRDTMWVLLGDLTLVVLDATQDYSMPSATVDLSSDIRVGQNEKIHSAAMSGTDKFNDCVWITVNSTIVRLILKGGKPQIKDTLLGHSGYIYQLLANSQTTWSASSDYTIRVWDNKTGKSLQVIKLDSSTTYCMSLSSKAEIFCGGEEGIQMYSQTKGPDDKIIVREEREFELRHETPVRALVFSNQILVSVSEDVINVWQ